MQRIALFAAAFVISVSFAFAQSPNLDSGALAQEMNAMTSHDWRQGVPFGNKLASLPGSAGYEILRDNWKKGASVEARKQMFKGFVFTNHPDTLKVLDLGATDSEVPMQSWSFEYLKSIAFIDFNENYAAYSAWFAQYGKRPLDEVRQENFQRFIKDMAASKGEARESYYRRLSDMLIGQQPLHSSAALGIVKEIFSSTNPSRDAIRSGGMLLKVAGADDAFMREIVLPGLTSKSLELRSAASRALAAVRADWVDDAFVALLKSSLQSPVGLKENGFLIGMAFGDRNEAKHIPLLIGAIAADNTYDTIYGLGYFGLSKLTGVSYDKTHDGQWWINWWAANKARFPEGVRALPIPKFGIPPKK